MFLVVGPQSPTILTNTTEVILAQTEYISKVIRRARAMPLPAVVDTDPVAEAEWVEFCRNHYPGSVWSRCRNWYNKLSQQNGAAKQPTEAPADPGLAGPEGSSNDSTVRDQAAAGNAGAVDGFIGRYSEYLKHGIEGKGDAALVFG